jgi:hypothetical protein
MLRNSRAPIGRSGGGIVGVASYLAAVLVRKPVSKHDKYLSEVQ